MGWRVCDIVLLRLVVAVELVTIDVNVAVVVIVKSMPLIPLQLVIYMVALGDARFDC